MIIAAKQRSKVKGIPFDLTFEWAKTRWTGFCELTGLPFSDAGIFLASLDRKIPANGYVQSNCRFILFDINVFKNDGTDEAMYFVAEALLKHRELLEATPADIIDPCAGDGLGRDDVIPDHHDALLPDLAKRHQ